MSGRRMHARSGTLPESRGSVAWVGRGRVAPRSNDTMALPLGYRSIGVWGFWWLKEGCPVIRRRDGRLNGSLVRPLAVQAG